MTPSYLGRLLLLSSAGFFLVHMVVEALIALLAPAAVRRAGIMRPERGARFLLRLRLLPAGFAAIVVVMLCVPSYLRFEPRVAEEEVGFACLAAAILGAKHPQFRERLKRYRAAQTRKVMEQPDPRRGKPEPKSERDKK